MEDEDEGDDDVDGRPRRNDSLQGLAEEGEDEEVDEGSTAIADEDATTVAETTTPQTQLKGKKTSTVRSATKRKTVPTASASATYDDDGATGEGGKEAVDEYRRLLGCLVMIDMPLGSKGGLLVF